MAFTDPHWTVADCIARHRKANFWTDGPNDELEPCFECNHRECECWPAHYPGEPLEDTAAKAAGR